MGGDLRNQNDEEDIVKKMRKGRKGCGSEYFLLRATETIEKGSFEVPWRTCCGIASLAAGVAEPVETDRGGI